MTIRSEVIKFILRILAVLILFAVLMSEEHMPHLPHEQSAVEIVEGEMIE